jgi:DNA-binding transcriptional regulator/RsmH inhibitor MraZ
MSLPIDEKLFAEGYCVGEYEITVDVGPRVRLPRAVLRVLKEHKVRQLWRFPDPSGPRMILCPAQDRLTYIEVAKQNFPASMEAAEAYRKYICTGRPMPLSNSGNLSITSAYNRYLKITAGQRVVLVGVGLWYELWHEDDWAAEGSNKSDR